MRLGEVEDLVRPGGGGTLLQVLGDDSGDCFAHSGVGNDLLARGGVPWGADVRAQYVNADLRLAVVAHGDPVVGEGGHGVNAGETDGCRVVTELGGDRGVPVAQPVDFFSPGSLLVQCVGVGRDLCSSCGELDSLLGGALASDAYHDRGGSTDERGDGDGGAAEFVQSWMGLR